MLVPDSKLFNLDAFAMHDKPKWEFDTLGDTKIAYAYDLYKDLPAVRREIEKLPMVPVHNPDNDNLFDARKSHSHTMNHTDVPYLDSFKKLIFNISAVPLHRLSIKNQIAVNCFTYKDFPRDTHYYNPHRDNIAQQFETFATVLFLNDHYEEGEGMNFYDTDHPIKDVVIPKETFPVAKFVQGVPNMGIVFNGLLTHGQTIATDQFKNEMRYTQVIFACVT